MTDLSSNGTGAGGAGENAMAKSTTKTSRSTGPGSGGASASGGSKVQERAQEMSAEAQRRLRDSLQSIEGRAQELRQWGMQKSEVAREVVEDKPLTVVASAFGIGLLIGLLASRV